MSPLLRRLRWFLGRNRFEDDLTDELRFHREQAAAEAERAGLGPDAARFAAQRRLGNAAQVAESAREVWFPPALAGVTQDIRYAWRGLHHRPGYTAASLLTITLAVGASTALFSVLNAVLLRPLPYSDAGRLVQVWEHNVPRDLAENLVSPANFLDWRERARSFESLAAYTWASVTLTGDSPEVLSGRAVTTNFFRVLGVRPALGRLFIPEDTLPGAAKAMVVSHQVWMRRFGGDSSAVGRLVPAGEVSARLVGVTPPDFRPMDGEAYWEPWPAQSELRQRRGRYALVIGRLRQDISADMADREMHTIAGALASEYPEFNHGWTADVVPLQRQVTGKARPVLLLLAGAIASVLLIACANVGNLKLGQVLARRTELTVRAALGASRGRILRQMLVEGVVLAGIGGVLGTLLASVGVRALVRSGVRQVPRLAEVAMDGGVLGFALLTTGLTGIMFGLAPLLAVREQALGQPLGRRGGEAGAARHARRVRGILVSAQVAMSLVLLAGAGLTVRSLRNLLDVDPGFDPANLLAVQLDLPQARYAAPERQIDFFQDLARTVRGFREVQHVGLVAFLPLRGITPATSVHVVGRPEPPAGQAPIAEVNTVDPGYFSTMGTPLLEGRALAESDRLDAPRVVLVNRAFARLVLGGHGVIGQKLRVNMADPDREVEIVGVVGDMRREGLHVDPRPAVFYPFQQDPLGYMTLVIRATGEVSALAAAVRREVAARDRALPVLSSETMESRLNSSLADRRYPMFLLILLAGLALVLSAVGLYGVLAYLVGQRSREIGVRRALGATSGAVARLVIREGAGFVLGGMAVGLLLALATTRYLGNLLYGLSPGDAPTLVGACAALLGVAALAVWLPARRAIRVDPAVTLREEG